MIYLKEAFEMIKHFDQLKVNQVHPIQYLNKTIFFLILFKLLSSVGLLLIQSRISGSYYKLMMAPRDEEIEAILGMRPINAPNINCASGHRSVRFCKSQACKEDALCCDEETCMHCEAKHQNCGFGDLKRLTKRVEDRQFFRKKVIRQIFIIENALIDQVMANRKEVIGKMEKLMPDEELSEVVEAIYFKGNGTGIKGKVLDSLFCQLSDKSKEESADSYLQQFKKQGETIIKQFLGLRDSIVNSVLQGTMITSKILQIEKEDQEKTTFLLKQLNYPAQLKLLFRASQHNFEAAKFHQLCNGIEDTLTIVRSQFGKTFAAYTPLQWSSRNNYLADDSKKSFILQLDLKEKFTLSAPETAIYDNSNFGPTFGCGHDIFLSDKCHQNGNNRCNIPSSFVNEKYKNGQKSYTDFCGAKNGYNFRVTEYEVFQVLRAK